MKQYHFTLKIFLLVGLIALSSSFVYASEVTGNLSSNGSTTSGQVGNSGSLSGSVVSGTTNGGSSGGSGGGGSNGGHPPFVAAASGASGSGQGSQVVSNGTTPSTLASGTVVSPDGTAVIAPGGLAFGTTNPTLATIPVTAIDGTVLPNGSLQAASAAGSVGNISAAAWFWILLLALILVAIIVYIVRKRYVSKTIITK